MVRVPYSQNVRPVTAHFAEHFLFRLFPYYNFHPCSSLTSHLKNSNSVSRSCVRVCVSSKLDSAEDLRGSTVPSAKRLAIIRNTLKAKFALHFRGAGRDEGAGNRFIGEKASAATTTATAAVCSCSHIN